MCIRDSPYAQFPVQFAVEGSAALVGPQTAVAEGGMTGTCLLYTSILLHRFLLHQQPS